jgi:hypothetical protein
MRDPKDDQVVAFIERAWAGAAYPGDDRLAGQPRCCGEYRYVADFFRARHWRDVTLETLKEYEGPANTCCSFMSGEALRFYLPAFMLIALDEPLDGPRSDWEASMVDVATWALLPPRYRPEVHALEQSLNPAHEVTSPESMARLRQWWDGRIAGLSENQRGAIVVFLARMCERHDFTDVREALEHWRTT